MLYNARVNNFVVRKFSFSTTDFTYFLTRSACYASIGQFADALEDGKKCVQINPQFHKGYNRVGHALLNLQRLDEAESAYKKGLEIAPEDKGLKDGLARVAQVKAGGAGAGMGI